MASDRQPSRLLDVGDHDRAAVTDPHGTLSWEEIEARARRLARGLDDRGLAGASWAVLSGNRAEWAEWALASARSGSMLVPLNWHLGPEELAELLADSESRLLVCELNLADTARKAAGLAGGIAVLVVGEDYETFRDSHGDEPLTERPAGGPMFYTGGTTGRSKGVVRSDGGGTSEGWVEQWSSWARLVRMPDSGRTLISTPLYHALGFAVFAASLASGVPVTIQPRFDPEETLAAIAQERVTSAPMVPTQFIRLLKLPDEVRRRYDVSSLRWILHTAAPCPEWAKRAMIEWWGPVIHEMYGSSEGAGPAVCDSHEWLAHPGTVGKATAAVEYSIIGEDGEDLPPGEVGTIYARRVGGPPEYRGDPDKTAAARLPDGRFTVGDLGWLDADGYLYLADRRVDLIITGGTNVYPAEIEAVLIRHPAVADAAVFGIPHPEWGQEIKAVLEPSPGVSIDLDDVVEFAAAHLAKFKRPASYDVVEQLPREAHGKLKKRLLRDPYWQ